MRFIDYIIMAFGNIARQKLRSTLTIFAVVIGATSVTIMLSLVFGAKSFFMQQLNANGTLQQIAISQKKDIENFDDRNSGGNCDDCVMLTDAIATKIDAVPHILAVSRQLYVWNFEAILYGDKKFTLQQVKAYDEGTVVHDTIAAGRTLKTSDSEGKVLITRDYADKFGFKGKYQDIIGKEVILQSRKGYSGIGATVPKPILGQQRTDSRTEDQPSTQLKATVVGVLESTDDGAMVRVPMTWARGMNTYSNWEVTQAAQEAAQAKCRNIRPPCNSQAEPVLKVYDYFDQSGYNSLIAKVDDVKNAKPAVKEIKKLGVGAADAESFIKQQLTIFNILGMILGGIGGISLAVAAVGVVNTMIMAIMERTREIGVMRAVGARKATIRRLFTFEAALLGFLGGLIGLGIGWGLTLIANPLINKQLADNGTAAKNIIGVPIWLILTVLAVTTVIGMLAGLYPAMRAARLDPVEALRYE